MLPKVIFQAILFTCLALHGYSQSQHTHKSVSNDSLFVFKTGPPLTEVLSEVAIYYKVRICNPGQVKGMPIWGEMRKRAPLKDVLQNISVAENLFAYLSFQNGVIFVSEKPFAKDFIPDKKDWPCQ